MKNPRSTAILVLACASFFGLGMVTAGIGPALPDLANNTVSSLSTMGSLFTGLFLGSLVAQVFSGPLIDRVGPRWLLLASLVIVSAGLLGVTVTHSLPIALASATLTGLGYGSIALIINVSISNLFPQRRASVLNLINMFYGIGAFIAPAVAGLFLRLYGSSLPALWLSGGLEFLLLPFFLKFFHLGQPSPTKEKVQKTNLDLFRSPVLWALSLLLLIYVGTENSAGGWVSTYMRQTTLLTAATAAVTASGFWLTFTAGRFLGTLLGSRWPARNLLIACLFVALIGGVIIIASTGNVTLSILGFLLLGLGLGPTFPTALAIVTASFTEFAGTATSLAMAMGFAGGMLIPWLMGVILETNGPRTAALLLPLGALMMLGFLAAAWYFKRHNKNGPETGKVTLSGESPAGSSRNS